MVLMVGRAHWNTDVDRSRSTVPISSRAGAGDMRDVGPNDRH